MSVNSKSTDLVNIDSRKSLIYAFRLSQLKPPKQQKTKSFFCHSRLRSLLGNLRAGHVMNTNLKSERKTFRRMLFVSDLIRNTWLANYIELSEKQWSTEFSTNISWKQDWNENGKTYKNVHWYCTRRRKEIKLVKKQLNFFILHTGFIRHLFSTNFF